ncbi:MAG: GlmU family protein [Chitinophagales bacterium]|nr:GlmU family protein [Chitinophagales bacterium]
MNDLNIILFDDKTRSQLLPFTFTRPTADIRVGILTLREKWEHYFEQSTSTLSADYLRNKFPLNIGQENLFLNGSVIPNEKLVQQIKLLRSGEAIRDGQTVIAWRTSGKKPYLLHKANGEWYPIIDDDQCVHPQSNYVKLNYIWEIFLENEPAIRSDFYLLIANKTSQPLHESNTIIGDSNLLFIEEGATVLASTLNTTKGPIYIGKDAEVMEGSLLRGPIAVCEHATIKMGTKVYSATTVGPYSKVGGELNNVVIFGYSNKAHDGFLGNAVIGEWCNLGADSNNSNLKNNYSEVNVWNYLTEAMVNSGLQFCGLFMGDHSKCSINTMFNTGTIVGVSANIFGTGFPPKHIPSFSWGGSDKGFTTYTFRKALETAEQVFARRGKKFDENEKAILKHVFKLTARYRKWDGLID